MPIHLIQVIYSQPRRRALIRNRCRSDRVAALTLMSRPLTAKMLAPDNVRIDHFPPIIDKAPGHEVFITPAHARERIRSASTPARTSQGYGCARFRRSTLRSADERANLIWPQRIFYRGPLFSYAPAPAARPSHGTRVASFERAAANLSSTRIHRVPALQAQFYSNLAWISK
jgi:hypothetical protein